METVVEQRAEATPSRSPGQPIDPFPGHVSGRAPGHRLFGSLAAGVPDLHERADRGPLLAGSGAR